MWTGLTRLGVTIGATAHQQLRLARLRYLLRNQSAGVVNLETGFAAGLGSLATLLFPRSRVVGHETIRRAFLGGRRLLSAVLGTRRVL